MKRDWWLCGICSSRFFTYMVFMTYAAALPVLQREWNMSAAAAGSISSGFTIGYAFSLIILSELADRIGPKRVYLWSNVSTAFTSLAFALLARGYYSGLILYTLISLALGGTYTTGIMLIADRYPSTIRGRAIGFFIASTSLSSTLSLGISGVALPYGGYQLSFLLTCLGPLVGSILIWITLASTPSSISPRREEQNFSAEVLRNKPAILLIMGYVFHNWELWGMWTWTPAFLAACLAVSGSEALRVAGVGANIVALFHFMGFLASLSMGSLSDRLGRAFMILLLGSISTACSFTMGWVIGFPLALVIGIGMIYGFSAIADSPILSAGLTERVEPSYRGAAFALRSFLGFSAGAISPLTFGAILDWTNPMSSETGTYLTWGWSYSVLGLGGLGVVGIAFILYKGTAQRSGAKTRGK
jgi:MFS family permease